MVGQWRGLSVGRLCEAVAALYTLTTMKFSYIVPAWEKRTIYG
jgi:hypothetical protein